MKQAKESSKPPSRLLSIIRKPLISVKNFYRNLPIKVKLVAVLNVIILMPLISISFISYRNTEEALKAKSVQYSQDILRMVGIRLTDSTDALEGISADLLSDERIYKVIDKYIFDRTALKSYENDVLIGGILKNTITSRDGLLAIGILVRTGPAFYANNSQSTENLRKLLEDRPEVLELSRNESINAKGKPIWYMDVQDGVVKNILLVRTMYHHDTYDRTGTLIMLVDPKYLSDAFEGLISDDMRNVRILSPDGDVILEKKLDEHATIPKVTIEGKKGWMEDKNTESLVTYTTIEGLGWKAVSAISFENLYRDIYEIRRIIAIACAVAVAFMSLLGLLMAVDIIGAISKLVRAMERVQRGEENVQIALERKDELGFMGDAFNRMVQDISVLEKWVYREQLTRREAELKALQSQINPHFLFNTLETINWMAILGNVPEISKTITALSSLMEASIMRDGGFVTFEEELRYIDNFIFILTKRFEDRLQVERNIEPEALRVKLPKLLIQPLVENAIYHGVENACRPCVVSINAYVENDLLHIVVEDNGTGLDEQELARINERLTMDDQTYFAMDDKTVRKGVGIDNVNRRIKLFYGAQYGLQIQSKKGVFTRAVVVIPVKTGEGAIFQQQGYKPQGL